ncbi:MAG: tRNA(His) guanylyltransferase Thg1 family protein [Thiotrichaceae bacterium]|nr:tRNA(His) guanylyltransferase Thg1 family protein [Thiotrichaceae bacterium]
MSQKELEYLQEKYKQREEDSLLKKIPDEAYLCIRLDGFHATKNHLKNVVTNKNFTNGLSNAHYKLFCSFRHYLNRDYTSSIVSSFMANDEISIILNKDNDNYDKRIMKLCTLFSGVLSSAATLDLNKKNKKDVGIVAFDSRPILLYSIDEISEYVRSRYLISKRYAYWKVLRLNNIPEVNEDYIKKSIDNSMNLAKENNLLKDAQKIISSYKFFLPEQTIKPNYKTFVTNDKNMAIDEIKTMLGSYLEYLHSTKRTI